MPIDAPPIERRSPKDTRKIIHRLSGYVFKWKTLAIVLIITILLTIACQLIVPILVQRAINCLIYRNSDTFLNDLTMIILALIIVFVLNSIIEYIKNKCAISLSEGMSLDIRRNLFDSTIYLPLPYIEKKSVGDILSRLINDSEKVSTVAKVIEEFFSKIIVMIGCAVIMLLESPKLALISIVTAIFTSIITAFISGKMRNYFLRQTIALGEMNGHIEESMKNYRTMEISGTKDYSDKVMLEKSVKYTDACIKSSMFSGIINPIMLLFGNLSFMVTVIVGGHLAIEKAITIGVLQAVIMYSKQFMDSVYGFGNVMIQTQSFLASAERVFELMDERTEEIGTPSRLKSRNSEEIEAGIIYKNVSFSYDGMKNVVEGIETKLSSGTVTALVGATGAGKTTLISLLLKFYDSYDGDIYIDGKNLKDISLEQARKSVTVVLQDSKLVDGTILDNIIYGAKGVDKEEVRPLLERLGVMHLIDGLPEGLDTITSDDDESISEGLKQIIGLARALIRKPSILVMDEALGAVDPITEEMVRTNIFNVIEDATVLVIAHRLTAARTADNIIVLKDGSIVEEGDFDGLISSRGEFYRLYNSQQEGVEI